MSEREREIERESVCVRESKRERLLITMTWFWHCVQSALINDPSLIHDQSDFKSSIKVH